MRIELTFAVALGGLIAGMVAAPAATFASQTDALRGATLDLSAQQTNQQQPKKKTQNNNRSRSSTTHRAPNNNVNRSTTVHRSVNPNTNTKTRAVTTTRTNNKTNVTTTRSRTVTTNTRPPRQVTFKPNRQTYTTRARAWHTSGHWNYRGRNYSYWRHGPWRHRYGNIWRTYAALTTLAAIAVGTATYYPYAYLDMPQDYCDGITEDGCQMSWTEVETLEGGVAPACVTYCPWQ